MHIFEDLLNFPLLSPLPMDDHFHWNIDVPELPLQRTVPAQLGSICLRSFAGED